MAKDDSFKPRIGELIPHNAFWRCWNSKQLDFYWVEEKPTEGQVFKSYDLWLTWKLM